MSYKYIICSDHYLSILMVIFLLFSATERRYPGGADRRLQFGRESSGHVGQAGGPCLRHHIQGDRR